MTVISKRSIWVLKPYPEIGARVEIYLHLYKNRDGKLRVSVNNHHRLIVGKGEHNSKSLLTDNHKICFKGKIRCNKKYCEGCEHAEK